MSALVVVTPPQNNLVVSVAEAKTHLRIESSFTDDDTYIANCISASVQSLEVYMNRKCLNQTLSLYLDSFPPKNVKMPFPIIGITSITSVTYLDNEGEQQTLSSDSYIVDLASVPQAITFIDTPEIQDRLSLDVHINFTCGYASANVVPDPIKQAVLIQTAFYYRTRTPTTDNSRLDSAEALVYPYKLLEFV